MGQFDPGADLEKYLWGGERGAGIFEGWQLMADVYILNLNQLSEFDDK